MQAPSLQTIPCPHIVPFGALPFWVHSGFPLPHSIAPVLQGCSVRAQSVPALHSLQTPSRQTLPSPQGLPLACAFVVSAQVAFDPSQTVLPTRQGVSGRTQGEPAWQENTPGGPPVPPDPPVLPPLGSGAGPSLLRAPPTPAEPGTEPPPPPAAPAISEYSRGLVKQAGSAATVKRTTSFEGAKVPGKRRMGRLLAMQGRPSVYIQSTARRKRTFFTCAIRRVASNRAEPGPKNPRRN
jgi:hypothetical protein